MTKHVALIDADVLLYRSCFAIESKVVTEDVIDGEVWASTSIEVEPVENAIQIVKDTMEMILFELNTNEYEMYLTGADNFRKELATVKEYKGNRKNARKPIHLEALREYCVEHFGATIVNGQEADDAIATKFTELGYRAIIVSTDKDYQQLPAKIYNWTKNEKLQISPDAARLNFMRQLLEGDSVDNIMGCPGIGPKKAERALDGLSTSSEMISSVLEIYEKQLETQTSRVHPGATFNGGSITYPHWRTGSTITKSVDEFVLEQGQLLHLLRHATDRWDLNEV